MKDPSNYVVVADAVMIVPETVGAFTYSTPATNNDFYLGEVNTYQANAVYAASANGRLLGFEAGVVGIPEKRMGRVQWIYPKVRTSVSVSPDAGGSDDPPMGETGPSPASFDHKVFIGSLSGKLCCVNTGDGTLE